MPNQTTRPQATAATSVATRERPNAATANKTPQTIEMKKWVVTPVNTAKKSNPGSNTCGPMNGSAAALKLGHGSRPLMRALATISTLMAKPPARPAMAPPTTQRSPSLGLRIIELPPSAIAASRVPGTSTALLAAAMELVDEVAEELGCERAEAERLVVAVVATIEERIPVGEVVELEAELPDHVRERMAEVDRLLDLPGMNDEAFRTRVAHRPRMTNEDGARTLTAVLRALEACLSPRERRRARLPSLRPAS